MEKTISVQQADIKTAKIEVKMLTVNNRNLTLSTFRQIPEQSVIDFDNIGLNGEIWGYVNYYWGKHSDLLDNPRYIHVLWATKEGQLRRCVVRLESELDPKELLSLGRRDYRHVFFSPYNKAIQLLKEKIKSELGQQMAEKLSLEYEEGYFRRYEDPKYAQRHREAYYKDSIAPYREDPYHETYSCRSHSLVSILYANAANSVLKENRSLVENLAGIWKKYLDLMDVVRASEQLFIAV